MKISDSKFIFILILNILFTNLVFAFDPPTYLKNISTNRSVVNPNLYNSSYGFSGAVTETGKFIFVSNHDSAVGEEIYVTDLSTSVTTLLKDINPGAGTSSANYFRPFGNDKVIFKAYSPSTGIEVWVSDGTPSGTVPVEIVAGETGSYIDTILTTVNGGTPYAIISAGNSVSGQELYRYNGISITLLSEVNPGPTNSYPSNLVIDNSGSILFSAVTAATGREPYRINFLTNTLIPLGDINPGPGSSNPSDFYYLSFYSESYFSANNGTAGVEPYVSDLLGSPTLISNISAGAQSSNPGCFFADASNNVVFFATQSPGNSALYSYNGAISTLVAPGTFYFPNKSSCAKYSGASSASRKMLFTAYSTPAGAEYWVTNGITTSILKDINVQDSSDPIYIGNVGTGASEKILFSANNGASGVELWSSDGTSVGTTQVNDLLAGINSSAPQLLGVGISNAVLLSTTSINPFADSYVKTNGTTAGTQVLGSATNNTYRATDNLATLDYFTESIGNQTIFPFRTTNYGQELFVTDGTPSGSDVLKDNLPGAKDGYYFSGTGLPAVKLGNSILFAGASSLDNLELWKTDGTSSGTVPVLDIYAGNGGSYPNFYGVIDNLAYFSASSMDNGTQLYKTDGTAAGTSLVTASKPVNFLYTNTSGITTNDKVFYLCNTPATGSELCVSDGTDSGSVVVKDIVPGVFSAAYGKFFRVGNKALMLIDDLVNGSELWVSDGTSAGTFMLSDINSGALGQSENEFLGLTIGNLFYFTARDPANGLELWRTDGTSVGTFRISDLVAGAGSLRFFELVEHKGKLFFSTYDSLSSQYFIYKSDGTVSGTSSFGELEAGNPYSAPESLTSVGGYLFMSAYHTVYGSELAYTTGDTPGSYTFIDLLPGADSSIPARLSASNGNLFFESKSPTSKFYELTKISVDKCLADDSKLEPGVCGCGVSDTDSDGDGVANCNDVCSADPLKTSAGACGCGIADTDSDADGVANCNDVCSADPLKTSPGVCGCGVADTDSNANGQADCTDNTILNLKPAAPIVSYNKRKKELTFKVFNRAGFRYYFTVSQMNSKGTAVLGKKTFIATASTFKKKLTELLVKRKKLRGKVQFTYQLRVGTRLGKVSSIKKLTI